MSESGRILPPGGCFRSASIKSIIQPVSKRMKHVVDNQPLAGETNDSDNDNAIDDDDSAWEGPIEARTDS
ncbi:hypothetical protein BM221_000757 [Beauveria bassiana]|uniref:Uncharacterized protein n=1 Tax=Beauveria bassiana TaxID=176275 RepID=A0A2N6P1D7_BEABA|nr:hypothetical protein BM221_000757 [Beauveria bassiana]